MRNNSAALIIGYTIQGLALARELAAANIPVYVMERGMSRRRLLVSHPLSFTKHGRFLHYENLLGQDLIESLHHCRSMIRERDVVLFPASDNTVTVLAKSWEQLKQEYILSWAACRDQVGRIIQKGALPNYCELAGVKYPKTAVIESDDGISLAVSRLVFPVLVKPNKPASSFKTHLCRNESAFKEFVYEERANWPLIAQEWIEGPDDSLFAYTCFLHNGVEVFGFAARKIRSSPPGLGRATVIESLEESNVRDAARRLTKVFDVSGPCAMEFKKDRNGEYWFIEANVGRTEYCVDLAIQSGFNMPVFEYCQALGLPFPEVPRNLVPAVWYDTDKEPLCYLSVCLHNRSFAPLGKKQIFPYWRREPPTVVFVAAIRIVREFSLRALAKVKQLIARAAPSSV